MSEDSDFHGQATESQKAVANLVVGLILAVGQVVYSIFHLIFNILVSISRF